MALQPSIGQMVVYRDPRGLDSPAIITATRETLDAAHERNAELFADRLLKDLSSPTHVHLIVLSALTVPAGVVVGWDIPKATEPFTSGTWRWLPESE